MAKRKIKRYPKSMTIWNSILEKINHLEVYKMRANLGLPKIGLSNSLEYEKWYVDVIQRDFDLFDKRYKGNIPRDAFVNTKYSLRKQYVEQIRQMINDTRVTKEFNSIIDNFLIYENVETDTFLNTNATGCSVDIVEKDIESPSSGFDMHIKVESYSSIEDIRNFLKLETTYINFLLKRLNKKNSPTVKSRLKHANFAKNEVVKCVSQMEKKELKDYVLSKEKDHSLLNLKSNAKNYWACKYLDYKFNIRMTEGNFRTTLHRLKKL